MGLTLKLSEANRFGRWARVDVGAQSGAPAFPHLLETPDDMGKLLASTTGNTFVVGYRNQGVSTRCVSGFVPNQGVCHADEPQLLGSHLLSVNLNCASLRTSVFLEYKRTQL